MLFLFSTSITVQMHINLGDNDIRIVLYNHQTFKGYLYLNCFIEEGHVYRRTFSG